MNHHSWKRIGIELLLLFVISLTPLLWFREGKIFIGHDNTYPLEARPFLENRLHTWSQNFFGFDQSLILGTIPIHALDSLPTNLGFDRITGQKIVYVTWFFLIGLSAYILALVLRPQSGVFKGIAVLFYQFNFYILQGWWIGEKSKFSAYIAAPIILALCLLVARRSLSVMTGSILVSLTLFFFNAGGLYGIPLYGGLMVIVGCFVLWMIVATVQSKQWSGLLRMMSFFLLSLVLTVLVNAYYIVPGIVKIRTGLSSAVSQVGGTSGVLSWADQISANASLINLMRLQGIPDWYDNPDHPYAKEYLTNPILIGASFLFPVLIFASFLTTRKGGAGRSYLGLFFLIYLVGMFFTAGTHPPLGFLYQLLVERSPGFLIFRSPFYKFAGSLMFAQAFLTAFYIDSISPRWRKPLVTVLGIGLFLYYAPYFNGNFFRWREGFSTRLAVPEYVFSFGAWLEQNQNARVLMIPPNSPTLGYSLYNWGYLSFQALPTLVTKRSVIINNDQINQNERALVETLYLAIADGDSVRTEKLIRLLGITHILLAHDTVTDVASVLPLDPSIYEKGLLSSNSFERLAQFGQWDLYERSDSIASRFAIAADFDIIGSPVSDANIFIDHVTDPAILVSEGEIPDIQKPSLVVAQCANCPSIARPVLTFPTRPILPGDPFYSVVTFLGRFRPLPSDPKSAIYALLGTTIKEIAEINELVLQRKKLTPDLLLSYENTLEIIVQRFGELPTMKDKITVSSDVAEYLRQERNFLRPALGTYLTGGENATLVGNIIEAISEAESKLSSFSRLYEVINTRLYEFSTQEAANYRLFVRIADLIPVVGDEPTPIVMTIDGKQTQLAVSKKDMSEVSQAAIGTLQLSAGTHILSLDFPQVSGQSLVLNPIETDFSVPGETSCFGVVVSSVTGNLLHQLQVRYTNNYSNQLLLYVWEMNQDIKRLAVAVRLDPSDLPEEIMETWTVSPEVDELVIAACADNMTEERASGYLDVTLSTLLNPRVVLVPETRSRPRIAPIETGDNGPIRYEMKLPEGSGEQLLVFYERFDPWWEISGVNAKHIRVNGFANGWLIEDPNGQTIEISYRGEKYFLWGVSISAGVLLVGLAILWQRKRKTHAVR